MNETRSDSDNEDGNFDSSHLPRSEEIIVVSNVKIVPIFSQGRFVDESKITFCFRHLMYSCMTMMKITVIAMIFH